MPPEFDDKDAYIDFLCETLLPEVAALGMADAVDAFCEGIAFSTQQVKRYFEAAKKLSLPVKIHAEQLSSLGGATMAASFQALSADHIEFIEEADVRAMANAGTVAVLLPGAFFHIKRNPTPTHRFTTPNMRCRWRLPPMLTPARPPALSLRLMMNMGCTLFGLTPEESLAGATIQWGKSIRHKRVTR